MIKQQNSNTSLKSEIDYFEKIDVIRFVAASMVVIYHAYSDWTSNWHYLKFMTVDGDQKSLSSFGKPLNTLLMNGGYGVDIFFLISGFLITYLLLKEKEASNGKINVGKFYVRRSLRIWPLYFLIIILSPALIKWVGQTYSPNYTANIFFYNNFDTMQNHYWVFPLAHFWSLCIEEHFYIFWPLIIYFIPNRFFLRTCMALILVSIIYRGHLFMNVNEPWYPLFLSTFSRFDVLVMGAMAAYIHFTNPIKLEISKATRLIVYSVFIIAICYDNITTWDGFFLACFKKYFYISIVLFAMLNFLFNTKPLFEFMNNKIFRYLGKVSFGIYVYGLIILRVVTEKIMKPYEINSLYVYVLIVAFLTIVIPILSFELFEKQVLKLKKKFEVIRIKKPEEVIMENKKIT